MRSSLYVTIRGQKIVAEPIGVVEGKARFKAEAVARPDGATEIQRWTSDGGIVARKKFSDAKVVSVGQSFGQGNDELRKRTEENRRRSMSGLPTIEEEEEKRRRTGPKPSDVATTLTSPVSDSAQDADRKQKQRKPQ